MALSILLWRSILQWLGGVGFIVMAVAVLPMLNVGGMKLFQTDLLTGLIKQPQSQNGREEHSGGLLSTDPCCALWATC